LAEDGVAVCGAVGEGLGGAALSDAAAAGFSGWWEQPHTAKTAATRHKAA